MSTKLIDITKQLTSFLSSGDSSILLKETNGISGTNLIEAHIQKSRFETDRSGKITLVKVSDSSTNCLNIVHVAVADRNRRKGLFSDFLELLERFDYRNHLSGSSNWYIRVDKVMNPILDECLPKKGYARFNSENEKHFSYFKIIRYNNETSIESPQKMESCPDMAAISQSPIADGTFYDH